MKTQTPVLLLAVALLLPQATAALAQAKTPPYLSQFPPVERVKAEIKGSDPVDTAARQQEAFWLLNQMITELAGRRFDADDLTRAEDDLRSRYGEAFQWYQYKERAPAPQDQARWHKLIEFYEHDPVFLDELLRRFFMPELRAGYYRATGKKPAAASPDSPVAGARAAGVDAKVFGIQMGELLTVPVCPSNVLFVDTTNTCVEGNPLDGNPLAAAIIGAVAGPPKKEDPDTRYVQIHLGQDLCAEWMLSCGITAMVHKEVFVGAYIATKGRTVEAAVAGELEGKYGKRYSSTQQFITANNGAKFTVYERVWVMPGLYVDFHPVNKEIVDGLVRVETEIGHKIRTDKEREAKKPKL
jgi:hypothetical protein